MAETRKDPRINTDKKFYGTEQLIKDRKKRKAEQERILKEIMESGG